ncbi:TonB-dependent receptor [Sphingomonas sp. A2-49]|uniref:TonB-dependent receptor n=1 Tax=Sphingomonas sp. A2-49 TaxID=1391375 RepID=UPI0021CEAD2B|nr:TonB-dependent receptor [Sphingomonas sp. A2-49]MCU6453813.1 TonB-dependent receptor [Sphingomonas sp. A2-49]
MRLTAYLLSAATIAIATPAVAQNTSPEPASPATQTTTATAAASVTQDDQNAADIVVTAQGRAQALADVPVAVSAISAETLQNSGANDIRQLNQLAPSLLVSSTGSEANGSARIRGIGTVGDNPGLESSVAVFIDGVYRSRSGIGLTELGEIERIEVLRGPQGTLGGRNSSAGLISIVSKAPSFAGFSGGAEATYGNYNFYRVAGNLNLPLGETIAARVDGVYVKRDGFYHDYTNNTDVNDRNRYFVRGQLLFEPSSDISFRLIGDYTKRDEKCCAATYVDRSVNPTIGSLNEPLASVNAGLGSANSSGIAGSTGNNIVNVIRDLGQPLSLVNRPGYSREISVSPGRSFAGTTKDWGVSGQLDWNLGGTKLTSITAYRDYDSSQGSDTDYSRVDILYRAANGNSARRFRTFTQELRLNGSLFDEKLDWLVGGFFANENLRVLDNLRFGSQYGRFATCRLISGGALAQFYSPGSAGCLSATGRAVLSNALAPAVNSPFGAAGATIVRAIDTLDAINDKGSTRDVYNQNSRNWALFTHNIFHVTSTLDLTLGVRYTNERKKFDAAFTNDNTGCVANQQALTPFLANAGLAPVAGGIIGLSCQGNSTSELNGVRINSQRKEDQFTGTAILSWKPIDDLLLYGSYSRGYKAGGFNLDRSALKLPLQPVTTNGVTAITTSFASVGGAQALVGNLQFAPETVNSFEIGAKYGTGPFSLSVAAFRQDFKNFQLNTFDGSVFIVQNINGCSSSLNGGDRDQSKFTGATNYSAAAGTTGACPAGDVGYGVRAQGVELEASLVPARDVRISLGATFTDTGYRDNLVGTGAGAPLNQSLRKLPGQRLSNSSDIVTTASASWTPQIGGGYSALFYADTRMTSDYNTGSDLFPQKVQDGYAIVNARIGLRTPDEKFSLEFWGQNLANVNYAQVAFNSPFQEGGVSAAYQDPQYPGGRQLFSQFLAEPRTYGATIRARF